MSTNRDGKAAVVDAVRSRLESSTAAVVTEYRGLTVTEMATLRRTLRGVGGDYKVFKNTLVRRAIEGSPHDLLAEFLEGPTAIAFVHGDVSAVAKALRDFARGAPALIVKGGVLDGAVLGARDLTALADLPSREVLLAQFAGALSAPMRTMAGLLQALPQSLAYGLAALLEQKGGARVATAPDEAPAGAGGPDGVAEEPGSPEAAAAEATVDDAEATVDDAATTEGTAVDAVAEDAQPEDAADAGDASAEEDRA